MKKTTLLFGLCLLPLLIRADEKTDPQKHAHQVIEEHILKPLKKDIDVTRQFSRSLLMMPVCVWGPVLEDNIRAFTIHTPTGTFLLGLYEEQGEKIFLLDTNSKVYIPFRDHPRFENLDFSGGR